MFGQIRRHSKWLWFLISGAVIISFVWYFNPNQQAGVGGSPDDQIVGSIYGEPLHRRQYNDAFREAKIQYRLSYGEWPADNEFTRRLRPVEREARSRVLLVRKLKDLDIHVSDAAVADWIATVFRDPDTGTFRRETYESFLNNLPRDVKPSDFERFARHHVGITHLIAMAGTPGKLVPPSAVETEFRQANEKVDTKVALFTATNFIGQVEADPAAVGRHFTNNASQYRLPERVQLSYVAFAASNYLAAADEKLATETNLNQQIDALYLQRGPQFYTDASGQPMTPEAAKQRIREEIRHDIALRIEARRDAFAFATELDEMPAKTNAENPAENLENLANARQLRLQISEPFSRFEGPRNLNVPEQFTTRAFNLTVEQPIVTEPVLGEDAVYVFGLRRRLPSELPELETIQDRVTEDYRLTEALRIAREAGQAFASSVTNSLAEDKSFEAVAQEAGVPVIDLPPIPREGMPPAADLPPQVDVSTVRSTAFNFKPGQASGFLPAREGGVVVYVEQFQPVQDAELQEKLPQFAENIRRERASRAFNAWFSKEMQQANLRIVGDEVDEEQ